MEKTQIRNLIKQKRLIQNEKERVFKSKKIMENIFLLPELQLSNIKGKNIALFRSFGGEPEMIEIFKKLFEFKANCFFPVIDNKKLYMQQVIENDTFHSGELGIKEPLLKNKKFIPVDIVFLPGIAFTEKGDRIGFGKGHYDIYLNIYPKDSMPLLISPIFEFQIVPVIQVEHHDVPVDILVTEKRVIKTNAR